MRTASITFRALPVPSLKPRGTSTTSRSNHRRSADENLLVTRSRSPSAAVYLVDVDEEHAKTLENRADWYEARWCALDQPEWNTAKWMNSEQVTLDTKRVTVEIEVSRQRVALLNAYKRIGQVVSIRVNNGIEYQLKRKTHEYLVWSYQGVGHVAASAPFPEELNYEALYIVRGDMSANAIKIAKDLTSVKAPVDLLVTEDSCPDLYQIEDETTPIEVGPFRGEGLRLRDFAIAIYRYPTVVIFVEGDGIAAARALVYATSDIPGLSFPFRSSVRLYYKAPNAESFIFQEEFDEWKAKGCAVQTTTNSFQDAFDDDDTLVYEPFSTMAVILTGGDAELEKSALEVCKDAEITAIVRQSEEEKETVYVRTGAFQV